MVCYLTSFESSIVFVTISEIFVGKIPDLVSGRIKVIHGHSSRSQSIVHRWFLFDFHWWNHCICHHFLNVWCVYFDYLEPSQFKVVEGQRSLCQSKAHWWFVIWPLLCPTLCLLQHSRYLMWMFCLTSFKSNIASMTVFDVWDICRKNHWHRSSTVQGHPRLKIVVPFGRLLVVSYLTSIVSNIVSLMTFKVFDVQSSVT